MEEKRGLQMRDCIRIKNARIHNLKGIDVTIPKYQLTVITGVSGSGKSSLAFDTLYEEGKKRYLSFSGSQLIIDNEQNFDSISGLSPTVAVEQRIIRQSNPRSTVGTRIKLETLLAALMSNYGVREPEYDDGIPLDVAMFQKNSPRGMCAKCLGRGVIYSVDEDALFHDKSLPISGLFGDIQTHYSHMLVPLLRHHKIKPETIMDDLDDDQWMLFKYGDGRERGYMGIIPWLIQAYSWSKDKDNWISKLTYINTCTCPKCEGTGLGVEASHTRFGGKTITELQDMYIDELRDFLVSQHKEKNLLLENIIQKLNCMVEVGLFHLSLSRKVVTLSGGEIQRLFLASYLVAEMDSIIFIFDEPTIGLHEVEKENLVRIIRRLVDAGNTVVAVEHDENFMREADYIIDIGPFAGEKGGLRIYEGGFSEFLKCKESNTSAYLAKEVGFTIKHSYRPYDLAKSIILKNATLHNLRNVTVTFPLGVMIGIAGVSGSGKSTLVSDTLVPKLKELLRSKCVVDEKDIEEEEANQMAELCGTNQLKGCYVIDQRPIGRVRTSCPATYTGIMDQIRNLFAGSEGAKERGYVPGMFSLNGIGGCKKCKGTGVVHYYVGYNNFIDVDCEECGSTGFVKEALEIEVERKNIRDILDMSVEEAMPYFKEKDAKAYHILETMQKVGLGYIKLGQATPTISGGESQRIKLAKELSKGKRAKECLYILDEPTTGLSFYDSEQLMKLMNELVDMGNTIIVTEHDPYILSNCDYIIEMGPGGGNEGGFVIATGTPEELKHNKASVIGGYLK